MSQSDNDLLLLRGPEIEDLLRRRESEVLDSVSQAYCLHSVGDTHLPKAPFLRLPGQRAERIIALPACLLGPVGVAGIKWIASAPRNLEFGLPRASAVLILNSLVTGRPTAILEGSHISANRTAASAALAARVLRGAHAVASVGLIGCGLINSTIYRYLAAQSPELQRILCFDIHRDRCDAFASRIQSVDGGPVVAMASDIEQVLAESDVVSFATTAAEPYVTDASMCRPGTVVLNISLRDLAPEFIIGCRNVVDDVDHVLQEGTSLQRASQQASPDDFIDATIGDLLSGRTELPDCGARAVVFSPFGLGILDVAVATLVVELAQTQGCGTQIHSFFGEPLQN